jgi:hypothetical protein
MVAHACNSSYSGDRDEENYSLRPARDPISKIPNTKKGWQSGSSSRVPASKCEALSSNPSTGKKTERESTKRKKKQF